LSSTLFFNILYKLDYADTIGDLKTRFKYAKTKPNRFVFMLLFLFYDLMLWMQGWCHWSGYHFTSFKYYSFYPGFLWTLSISRKACHSRL